ncbi:hypothetical protein GXW82_06720 [Streptacidiphilus sp. 4-A2]|nr:hypothetical protein [Streptacidiphilus sp. 4-A2]
MDAGASALIVQGAEAGGHHLTRATLPLVRRCSTASGRVPVVVAGGIADGRGLAAARRRRRTMMGTRFAATEESLATPGFRAHLVPPPPPTPSTPARSTCSAASPGTRSTRPAPWPTASPGNGPAGTTNSRRGARSSSPRGQPRWPATTPPAGHVRRRGARPGARHPARRRGGARHRRRGRSRRRAAGPQRRAHQLTLRQLMARQQ